MKAIIEELGQNELRIFRAVYEKGPISRVRLARGLHLTRAAVTILIKRLTQLGLIVEVGKGNSGDRRGRREVLLTVNPEAGVILAVHISLTHINYGLVTLNGRILIHNRQHFPENYEPSEVLSAVTDELKRMLDEHCKDSGRLFGVSVAIPGIIDYKTGTVREQTRVGWQGFNLKNFFEKQLDLNVFVENDVKALTLGEFYFGMGRHSNDMVCLWSKDGIGAGIIHDGRLIRGYSSSAGEIGFNQFILELPINRSILVNGKPRCWGDILSFTNLRASIDRGVDEGWKTSLKKGASIDDFINAYEDNDPLAIFIISTLASVLGMVSCNLIYSYNPQVLVLAGPLFEKIPNLTLEVKKHLDKGLLKTPLTTADLKASVLGEDSILIGCAALHLEYIFKASEQVTIRD